jgi:hypothetical protein
MRTPQTTPRFSAQWLSVRRCLQPTIKKYFRKGHPVREITRVCWKPIKGRGLHKRCKQHSKEVRAFLRSANNAAYVKKHRNRYPDREKYRKNVYKTADQVYDLLAAKAYESKYYSDFFEFCTLRRREILKKFREGVKNNYQLLNNSDHQNDAWYLSMLPDIDSNDLLKTKNHYIIYIVSNKKYQNRLKEKTTWNCHVQTYYPATTSLDITKSDITIPEFYTFLVGSPGVVVEFDYESIHHQFEVIKANSSSGDYGFTIDDLGSGKSRFIFIRDNVVIVDEIRKAHRI